MCQTYSWFSFRLVARCGPRSVITIEIIAIIIKMSLDSIFCFIWRWTKLCKLLRGANYCNIRRWFHAFFCVPSTNRRDRVVKRMEIVWKDLFLSVWHWSILSSHNKRKKILINLKNGIFVENSVVNKLTREITRNVIAVYTNRMNHNEIYNKIIL